MYITDDKGSPEYWDRYVYASNDGELELSELKDGEAQSKGFSPALLRQLVKKQIWLRTCHAPRYRNDVVGGKWNNVSR
eukprot:scaffold11109_cov138-Amphora_coffeaeformis.AAC.3